MPYEKSQYLHKPNLMDWDELYGINLLYQAFIRTRPVIECAELCHTL